MDHWQYKYSLLSEIILENCKSKIELVRQHPKVHHILLDSVSDHLFTEWKANFLKIHVNIRFCLYQ